ncbi:glycoside hydrolase family 9 protein [Adhaeribacter pallidiroseus]|uniref:Endoglucanase n=1 Tax=Adhaeribacter pallidiroseus TaxID=2072847 RepID=A0A369QE33_9BACT|nr:glycoside hydrolase family 9 protein [Adhaeribacter pallidiroseus]RDC61825.1 Cellulase [Adhaeribacter pallidiroseus]
MHFFRKSFIIVSLSSLPFFSQAQTSAENIRLNQVGFYPQAEKLAIVLGEPKENTFHVKTADGKKTVFTGKLSPGKPNEFSQKPTRVADFSNFKNNGRFVVEIPGMGTSYAFQIQKDVHKAAAAASLKGFYYQRVSINLPEKYAGKWHRPAGHAKADTEVLVHPSAASAQRPANTVISSPRGWYDAGDYNKYIVNSGITMGTLLAAYEDFPDFFKNQKLNIPESTNPVPDILDEVLWNLRWMLTMQDPNDGGVYHKLTNPAFDSMIMPDKAVKTRYVVQKSTAATLDFAAVMAQASRVYKNYNRELPGLSDSCLTAAVKAWEWAQKNPNVLYEQEAINKQFEPKITTGTYGDRNVSDELTWAGAELYVTTKKDTYYTAANINTSEKLALPSWAQVKTLGYYTLARFSKNLTPAAQKDLPAIKKQIGQFADELLAGVAERSYRTVMGKSERDYIWGSSAVAANQGIALVQAYKLTNDKKYLQGALSNLDYLLGRNAVGYSFLTGFGKKSTMHPHHRPSVADGIVEPVPGLLSGGTNARAKEQDKCPGYTATSPDEVYLDQDCSYASNEIAINWNSPFVYLASAIEALQNQVGATASVK